MSRREQAGAPPLRRAAQAAPSLPSLCWGTVVRPRQTARVIAGSTARRQGWAAVGGFAGLYSLAALTAYLTGRRPQRSPLMRVIPRERYYLAEALFEPPVTCAWMTLFAVLVRGVGRRFGGQGTRASDFSALAVAHTVPLVVAMWIPDMACYLGGLDERTYRRLVAAYAPAATAWALAASTIAVCEVEQIPWPKAAVTVVVADAVSAVATGIPLVMR